MAVNPHPMGSEERDAHLDRLYPHTGREGPRKEIDDAIKAAARREVRAHPRPLGAQMRRWGVPISIAAVVVVSVSLVTLMREEGADRLEEGYAPPVQAESKEKRKPSEKFVGGSMGDTRAIEKATNQPPVSMVAPQEPPSLAAPKTPPARISGDVAPSASDDSARARASAGPGGPRLEESQTYSGVAREEGAFGDDKGLAPQAVLGRQSLGKKAELDKPGALSEPARRLQSAPARADQDRPAKQAAMESEHSQVKDRVASMVRSLDRAGPESWIEQIKTLRRDGQDEEADALLKEFRRRFPDHPLAQPEAKDLR